MEKITQFTISSDTITSSILPSGEVSEEKLTRHLPSGWSDTFRALTFLQLQGFQGEVFTIFPVDLTPCAADYFWPFGEEGIRIISVWLHLVCCCQNFIAKYSFHSKRNSPGTLIGSWTPENFYFYIFQVVQYKFIIFPDHATENLSLFKCPQPEVRDALCFPFPSGALSISSQAPSGTGTCH